MVSCLTADAVYRKSKKTDGCDGQASTGLGTLGLAEGHWLVAACMHLVRKTLTLGIITF